MTRSTGNEVLAVPTGCRCGGDRISTFDGTCSHGDDADDDVTGIFVRCDFCGREVFGLQVEDAVRMWNGAMHGVIEP